MRARFTSTTRDAGGARQLSGVLLVARPDRLRFRLSLPLGLTVLDYVRTGDRAWVRLPMGGSDAVYGYASQTLPRTFARFTEERNLQQCDAYDRTEPERLWVICYLRGGDVAHPDRLLAIRARDGVIDEEHLLTADGVASITRYDDYRSVDGAYLPFRILIHDIRPGSEKTVDVAIERYEVNPVLRDDVFLPAPNSEPIAVVP
jgi:hypothetical protein